MDLSPLFTMVSRGRQFQETVGWNIAAEREQSPISMCLILSRTVQDWREGTVDSTCNDRLLQQTTQQKSGIRCGHCSVFSHKQTPGHFLQVPQTMYQLAVMSEQSGQKTQKWNCIMLVPPLAILLFKPFTFILMDDGSVTGPCARGME